MHEIWLKLWKFHKHLGWKPLQCPSAYSMYFLDVDFHNKVDESREASSNTYIQSYLKLVTHIAYRKYGCISARGLVDCAACLYKARSHVNQCF